MSWETATKTITREQMRGLERPANLLVDAGTGSVVVTASADDATYVSIATYTADGVYALEIANIPYVKISVTGNATYFVAAG